MWSEDCFACLWQCQNEKSRVNANVVVVVVAVHVCTYVQRDSVVDSKDMYYTVLFLCMHKQNFTNAMLLFSF